MAGHPRSFKTVKELQDGIDAYFAYCDENGFAVTHKGKVVTIPEPYSVSGLADSLGVSRETLHTYSTGTYGKPYSDAIKRAVGRIERDKVAKAMMGFYDRTIAIFDLKNNHGWKDAKEVSVEDKRKPARAQSIEEIDKRLEELQGKKAANG